MQVIIDVKSAKVAYRKGTSKSTGQPYEITTQRGYVQLTDRITGEMYPVPIEITLDQGAPAYEPGRYTLDASSLSVDRYGALRIARVRLMQLVTKAQSAA